jgi:hypothetical protein
MKINTQKLQKICSGILLAFILISFGYLLGKNSVKTVNVSSEGSINGNYIAVYYLHTTFRCETCNTIDSMTKDLLYKNYNTELDNGNIQWQEVDFMNNTKIAKQFNVAASCVVVALIDQGKIRDYKRLDEVWTLMKEPKAFNVYISDAIDGYLTPKVNK